ncbi:unnamed protein product [Rhizophagus irregularis]|nr:unnamed protein product [Rhizophagus irregularis]
MGQEEESLQFSNRLGISFTTTYHAFNSNVVAKKGLDFIYGKVYQDFSRTPTSSFPKSAPSDLPHNVSSVTSPTIVDPTPPVVVNIFENVPAHYVLLIPARPLYDGGVYNQPSRNQIRERKLKPLTVGSEAWLAHMEEIYNIHLENLQYDLDKKAAISQWNTTDEKDLLKKMQKAEEDEEILTHLRERIAHIDHVIYIKYHREEVGLKFHPCAVMDDRILK